MTEVNQTNGETSMDEVEFLEAGDQSISLEPQYSRIPGPAEWVGQFNDDEPFILFFEPSNVSQEYLESEGRKLEFALPPFEGINLIEFKSKDGQTFKITSRPKTIEDQVYTDFEDIAEPTEPSVE